MPTTICQADYTNAHHANAIVRLMQHYAEDPMGGGMPLADAVCKQLVAELARRDFALSILAFRETQAVGLINAFEGFSTFACKPLLNIHDVVVLQPFRGTGIARGMFEEIVSIARQRNCCKLTLEVLAGNRPAKALYRRLGFAPYQLKEDSGAAEFWQRKL